MTKTVAQSLLLLFLATTWLPAAAWAQATNEKTVGQQQHFVLKVLPILQSKCWACHGTDANDLKGDLDLTSLETSLAGGESGVPSIVVGSADDSPLVKAIEWADLEMPPKKNDRLTTEQIDDIRKWINDGVVWPAEDVQIQIALSWSDRAGGVEIPTVGGLSAEWSNRRYNPDDIWAFRPVTHPQPPNTTQHPVDAFIDAKRTEAILQPAPRAAARTLIRRASYDLTGLPPTPAEIDAFISASAANADAAWLDLIDRLLASPQYGEHWGQHWLDVVRYADTCGFSNDFERSNAWRYRDYVIRSFNDDIPYNDFVIQQIAGDEWVAEAKSNQLEPPIDAATGQIAVGFLRMGPWEHTGMSAEDTSRQNFLDDVTHSVGQTFLSTPLRCCKCHDHKFDPIPTADYYRVYAAFATTQIAEMPAQFLPVENRSLFEVQKTSVETLLAEARKHLHRLEDKREIAARKWYADRDRSDEYLPVKERQALKTTDKPPRHVGLSIAEEGELKVRTQDEWIWNRRLERFQPLAQSVYDGGEFVQNSRKMRPANLKNESQKKKHETMPASFILSGGSVHSPGQEVTPGALSCLALATSTATETDPYALPTEFTGRRLALARWIANEKNSLATRSIVNRVWHYHFGRGIAGNPNNFGASGQEPTHPELLDWLTTKFLDEGWSIKSLHRLLMTSATYQRATAAPDAEKLASVDPLNRLYSVFQPRRLSAEEIHDTMLANSGELNLEYGGLAIRPEMNLEVALSPRMIQFSLAPSYQPERRPEHRNRRSVYVYRVRGMADPLYEVLDKPNSSESCEIRDSASTTPQAFTMFNSDYVNKRSIGFAIRLQNDAAAIREQIELGYQLTTGEPPSDKITKTLMDHYEKMVRYHQNHQPRRTTYPTKLTQSLVEELSGDSFEYEERLESYEGYVPDTEAAAVSPETRALADVCLLLFNSNQFTYVY